MNFSVNDWFPIRQTLKNLADDERENKKTIQSDNLIDPDKIDDFIRQIDSELGAG